MRLGSSTSPYMGASAGACGGQAPKRRPTAVGAVPWQVLSSSGSMPEFFCELQELAVNGPLLCARVEMYL